MPTNQLKAYLGTIPLFSEQSAVSITEWTRNPDWISLPEHSPGDERIDILFAVSNATINPIAFLMQGAYTVDWGDGSAAEDVADNVQAEHNYDYADLSADTEFTVGGTTFRQALISIVPQAGSNLTLVDFNRRRSGFSFGYSTAMMDIRLSIPNCTSLNIGGVNAPPHGLERVDWLSTGTLTSMDYMFQGCHSLQKITAFPGSVASVTSMFRMFMECYSLQTIPAFPDSVAAVTNMNEMFFDCVSLQTIPAFPDSVAAVTNMSEMFYNCRSLQTIPAFPGSVAAVTNMARMFNDCHSLQTIPAFPDSVAAVTNMANMFQDCISLRAIPAFPGSVAAVTTMGYMFYNCQSLQTIPAFPGSVAAVTNMTNMFFNCLSLRTIPAFPGSVAAVQAMNAMFFNCYSLQTIPAFPGSVAAVTNMSSMFRTCSSLQSIPAFPGSVAAVTNPGLMFSACYSLKKISGLPGIDISFSILNCALGRDEIVSLFNDLADLTGLASQTITITGNPGVGDLSAADLLIATNKNWTVAT